MLELSGDPKWQHAKLVTSNPHSPAPDPLWSRRSLDTAPLARCGVLFPVTLVSGGPRWLSASLAHPLTLGPLNAGVPVLKHAAGTGATVLAKGPGAGSPRRTWQILRPKKPVDLAS